MIAQSCNKILTGKTYWKSIVLPSVLYASSTLAYTKQEIQHLQRIENSVYRAILASKYAQVPTLRGEIGSSNMETRIRQNQLNYLKYVEENENNDLMRQIMVKRTTDKKDYWMETIKEFMKKISINHSKLKELTKQKLKDKINEWDNKSWQEEVAEKSGLSIYKKWKTKILEEKFYDNRPSSQTFYRARTNNLKLNEFPKSIMCNWGWEDLNNFLLWCTEYSVSRNKIIMQRSYIQEEEKIIGQLLFSEKHIEENKEIVHEMWMKREHQLKISKN